MVARIALTRGYTTLVDDEDAEAVLACGAWHVSVESGGVYAVHTQRIPGTRKTLRIRLHRFIMNAPDKFDVDHINGDGLDNRRSNLRLCTDSENQGNARKRRRQTASQYKGVTWHKSAQRWQAQIEVARKTRYLGLFHSELDAARAYDAAAKVVFGEFARCNLASEPTP
jgi:hypothetical protein